MAYGLAVYNSSGSLVYDTNACAGGVPLGIYSYSTGTTLSFPSLAGYTVQCLPLSGVDFDDDGDVGVTVAYGSGYPVVTVATRTNARSFMLAVF